jgi:phosphoribosylanthranilate isomerase
VWKAVRVGPDFGFARFHDCPAEALLLDGPAGELFGGAGETFDWKLARDAPKPIIVAGGLDASNVALAVELAHPWGVDACSRLESTPGKKDNRKMTDFLRAALEALGR